MSPNQIPYRYIAIEGNIGAGKSTLAIMLSQWLQSKLILEEFEDNSFLPKFYNDQRRYAFPLEMSFLAARFNQLKKQLNEQDLFSNHIVSDYVFTKCLLFSKVTLDEDEYGLYYKLFEIINQQIQQPDLLLYLHSPIEKLKWNISNRGRSYEQHIEEEYLINLQKTYFEYLNTSSNLKIVILDCSNMDFVNNEIDFEKIKLILSQNFKTGITKL
ncbi:MAG: deoxynucleoside kinase [Bacteroidetes bacterium]|nr:deoxynucleoside kinase [Bacteroidota bacterium]